MPLTTFYSLPMGCSGYVFRKNKLQSPCTLHTRHEQFLLSGEIGRCCKVIWKDKSTRFLEQNATYFLPLRRLYRGPLGSRGGPFGVRHPAATQPAVAAAPWYPVHHFTDRETQSVHHLVRSVRSCSFSYTFDVFSLYVFNFFRLFLFFFFFSIFHFKASHSLFKSCAGHRFTVRLFFDTQHRQAAGTHGQTQQQQRNTRSCY